MYCDHFALWKCYCLTSRRPRYIFMFWAGTCSLLHVINAEGRLISSQQTFGLSSGNKWALFMHGFLTKVFSTLSEAIYPNIPECHEMSMISCLVTKHTAEVGETVPFSREYNHEYKNNHCTYFGTKQVQHLVMGKQLSCVRRDGFRKTSVLFRNIFWALSLMCLFFPSSKFYKISWGKLRRNEHKRPGKQESEIPRLNSCSHLFSLRVCLECSWELGYLIGRDRELFKCWKGGVTATFSVFLNHNASPFFLCCFNFFSCLPSVSLKGYSQALKGLMRLSHSQWSSGLIRLFLEGWQWIRINCSLNF